VYACVCICVQEVKGRIEGDVMRKEILVTDGVYQSNDVSGGAVCVVF